MTIPHFKPAIARVEREEERLRALSLPQGTALAATGSLARRELTEYSDLDLLLLHEDSTDIDPDAISQLWYPLWDAGLKIDYAVRSISECASIVDQDVPAGLALLDLREIHGESGICSQARTAVLSAWRRATAKNFDAVIASATKRWRRAGSLVTMTRPDLKHGRGGLRDLDLLKAISLANLADTPELPEQRQLLLRIRHLLHQQVRRNRDILDPEYASDIALELGFVDRYELYRTLGAAVRDIDDALTHALAKARALVNRRQPWYSRQDKRRPLELDVVESKGEVTLARQPQLSDPGLVLRIAASAARYGLPIDNGIWSRLENCPSPIAPWPKACTQDFLAILSSSEHGRSVITELDAHGYWEKLVPEWGRVRGLMPAEPIHVHSIDQHLLETVAQCARRAVTVARPDLLLLGALFHDIGKRCQRPHEQVGAEMVAKMAAKLGYHYLDRSRVQTLVAEHTTLSRLIARHDIHDEATVELLLDAVHHDLLTLELLGVLTEADAEATAPGLWTKRKAMGRDILLAKARKKLNALHYMPPSTPVVHAPGELGVLPEKEDGFPVIYWQGKHERQLIRILAIAAAKAWNIEAARVINTPRACIANIVVRSTTGSQSIDEEELRQTYRSGVHTMLPESSPKPCAMYWHDTVIEIRTPDQLGVFGHILRVLPELEWVDLNNVGETLILRAKVKSPVHRAQTERDVARALGNR